MDHTSKNEADSHCHPESFYLIAQFCFQDIEIDYLPSSFIVVGHLLVVTGNSSQVSDGAAAVLLMKRKVALEKNLPILGVFR